MKKDKLNILIIPSWYPSEMDPNGVPFIRAQAQALSRAGHSVTVVFTQPYSLKTVLKKKKLMYGRRVNSVSGVKEILTYVPKTHFRRLDEITRLMQGQRELKRLIKENINFDIVHVHTYLAGRLGVWFSKKYRVPLVTTEHYTGFARGIVKPWELKRARELYYYSSLNLGVSGAFSELLYKKTGAPFDVLPNMVNTDLFRPESKEIKSNYTYLFVGSLHDKKNPIMLLNSFISQYKKDNSLRLILAGEGELTSQLQNLVKENGVQDAVEFPGFLNSRDVATLMQRVDSFILPSKFETFGIVVIEAMATGIPVIVTKSGGPESFVKDGINGLIIDQDQDQLTSAMSKVRDINWDKDVIRNYVEDNFSEISVVKSLTERYQEILNSVEVIQASRELSVSGGISKVAFQLAQKLTNKNYRVTNITTEQDDLSLNSSIGRVIVLPVPSWIDKLPPYFKNYIKTKYFTKQVHKIYKYKNLSKECVTISHRDSYGANIAIGHSCHREAVEIKKREGRFLWWINPIHPFYLQEERRIFKKPYPELAAISTSIADEYHRHYKVPQKNIHTIANGVDIDRFISTNKLEDRDKLLNEFNLPEGSFIVLFVGNEFKRKGLDFIIESLSNLDSNVHLFVLGGADKSPYLKPIENLKLKDRVHFTGRRSDAPYFFSAADLFVLPANYEPFGLVGIEALSSGTPLLAPKLGGFLDYLKDGENGFYIKREAKDISDKISVLQKDNQLWKTLSQNAVLTSREYSWENIGQQYSDLIDETYKNKQLKSNTLQVVKH